MKPKPIMGNRMLDPAKASMQESLEHYMWLVDHYIAVAEWYEELCLTIQREAEGCGPDCSKDFLRLGLTSVRDLARLGVRTAPQHTPEHPK